MRPASYLYAAGLGTVAKQSQAQVQRSKRQQPLCVKATGFTFALENTECVDLSPNAGLLCAPVQGMA